MKCASILSNSHMCDVLDWLFEVFYDGEQKIGGYDHWLWLGFDHE